MTKRDGTDAGQITFQAVEGAYDAAFKVLDAIDAIGSQVPHPEPGIPWGPFAIESDRECVVKVQTELAKVDHLREKLLEAQARLHVATRSLMSLLKYSNRDSNPTSGGPVIFRVNRLVDEVYKWSQQCHRLRSVSNRKTLHEACLEMRSSFPSTCLRHSLYSENGQVLRDLHAYRQLHYENDGGAEGVDNSINSPDEKPYDDTTARAKFLKEYENSGMQKAGWLDNETKWTKRSKAFFSRRCEKSEKSRLDTLDNLIKAEQAKRRRHKTTG
ncbi:MAG: hypothetical protein F9B45_29110 [Phycisphaera sp. RhM]|nr:hypothetical protein [Phycisphaera sp. RhM]